MQIYGNFEGLVPLKIVNHLGWQYNTLPKFNNSPLKNPDWKTRQFPFGMVTFQGRTVKLQVGISEHLVISIEVRVLLAQG